MLWLNPYIPARYQRDNKQGFCFLGTLELVASALRVEEAPLVPYSDFLRSLFFDPKMEVTCSPETCADFHRITSYIPEDRIPRSDLCEDLTASPHFSGLSLEITDFLFPVYFYTTLLASKI
jgi:hypothetical protein